MKITPYILTASLSVIIASPCTAVLAAGFQLNEHSANGLGRAYAGEAAKVENAAILAHNPAAMSQFKQTSLSAQLSFINPSIDVAGDANYSLGQLYNQQLAPAAEGISSSTLARVDSSYEIQGPNIAPSAFVPSGYLITPINDQFHFGLAIFSNFGLSTEYDKKFAGLEYADKTELTTININPNISYQVNQQLSFGFGLNAVYAKASLSTTTPDYFDATLAPYSAYNLIAANTGGQLPELPLIPSGKSIADVAGDGWDWGWNGGLLWSPNQKTTIALTYRSEVHVDLEGHFSSDVAGVHERKGTLTLDLPAMTELALNQELTDALSLQASINFIGWSVFETLKIQFDDDSSTLLLKEEYFKDAWRGALGLTYLYNSSWALRAGIAYDGSPVQDEYRTLSIPDADRYWLTLGASYNLTSDSSLDFGFAYIYGPDELIEEKFYLPKTNGELLEVSSLSASLDQVKSYIFSVQYNQNF